MRYTYRKSVINRLMALLDRLAGLLLSGRQEGAVDPRRFQNILIVNFGHLGDIFVSLPSLHALKTNCPGARVTLLVSRWALPMARIFAGKIFDDYLVYDDFHVCREGRRRKLIAFLAGFYRFPKLLLTLRRRRYDLAIDQRSNISQAPLLMKLGGARYRVGYLEPGLGFLYTHPVSFNLDRTILENAANELAAVGVPESSFSFAAFLRGQPDYQIAAARLRSLVGPGQLLIAQPRTASPEKDWLPEKWRALLAELPKETGLKTVIVGGGRRGAWEGAIDLTGQTSLFELMVLIDLADAFIGGNSVGMHLAAALGKKTLILTSGNFPPVVWTPRGEQVRALYRPVSCFPCYKSGVCATSECVTGLSVEEVKKALLELLP